MKLLLDTHIVQWIAVQPGKLNRDERQLIGESRNQLHISAVSLWEMRLKWESSYRSGVRKGDADPEEVIATLSASNMAYDELPLSFAHCTASLREHLDHDDPFDRLLLAQAQIEGMRLLTRDHKFEGHPLALFA